jgi:hypothetical protein
METNRSDSAWRDAPSKSGRNRNRANVSRRPREPRNGSRNDSRAAREPRNGSPKSSSGGSSKRKTIAQRMTDRVLYATTSLVGSLVGVALKDGTVIEAIFFSFMQDKEDPQKHKILLKLPAVKDAPENSKHHTGKTRPVCLVLDSDSYVHMWALEVDSLFENPSRRTGMPGFITDNDISQTGDRARKLEALIGRELKHAGNEWTKPAPALRGDAMSERNHVDGEWDQFEANKRLFNVESTYDESLYTTELPGANKRDAGLERKAAQLADEISSGKSSAPNDAGVEMDPEDRWSGVLVADGGKLNERGNDRVARVMKTRETRPASGRPASGAPRGAWRSTAKPSSDREQGRTDRALAGFSSALGGGGRAPEEKPAPARKPEAAPAPPAPAPAAAPAPAPAPAPAAAPAPAPAPAPAAKTESKLKLKLKSKSKLSAKSTVFVPKSAKPKTAPPRPPAVDPRMAAIHAQQQQHAMMQQHQQQMLMRMNPQQRAAFMQQQIQQQQLAAMMQRGMNPMQIAYAQQQMAVQRQHQMAGGQPFVASPQPMAMQRKEE